MIFSQQHKGNTGRHRLGLVFDREGYLTSRSGIRRDGARQEAGDPGIPGFAARDVRIRGHPFVGTRAGSGEYRLANRNMQGAHDRRRAL